MVVAFLPVDRCRWVRTQRGEIGRVAATVLRRGRAAPARFNMVRLFSLLKAVSLTLALKPESPATKALRVRGGVGATDIAKGVVYGARVTPRGSTGPGSRRRVALCAQTGHVDVSSWARGHTGRRWLMLPRIRPRTARTPRRTRPRLVHGQPDGRYHAGRRSCSSRPAATSSRQARRSCPATTNSWPNCTPTRPAKATARCGPCATPRPTRVASTAAANPRGDAAAEKWIVGGRGDAAAKTCIVRGRVRGDAATEKWIVRGRVAMTQRRGGDVGGAATGFFSRS